MLKKIFEFFFSDIQTTSRPGFFLKVRCGKCDEEFNLFIDAHTGLAQDFNSSGKISYFLKKEIIGSRCPNRIQVRMDFSNKRKLLSRSIEGGDFLD